MMTEMSMSLCLTLDTAGLAVLDVVRNLGVLFDKTLSGKDQVNRVVKQVFLKLRQLHYFLYLLSPSIKIKLVKSLVLPILVVFFVKLELAWKWNWIRHLITVSDLFITWIARLKFRAIVIDFIFLGPQLEEDSIWVFWFLKFLMVVLLDICVICLIFSTVVTILELEVSTFASLLVILLYINLRLLWLPQSFGIL
jgi:hypothetical protein